jgi:hypothetical protein
VQEEIIGELREFEDLDKVAVEDANIKFRLDVKVDHIVDVGAQESHVLLVNEAVYVELV